MIFKTKFSFKKFLKDFNRREFRVDEVKFREMVARIFYNKLSESIQVSVNGIIRDIQSVDKKIKDVDRWRICEALSSPYFLCSDGNTNFGGELSYMYGVVRGFAHGGHFYSTGRKYKREDVIRQDPFADGEDAKVYEFMEVIRGPFRSYRSVYGVHKGEPCALECFVRKYNQENKQDVYQVIQCSDLHDEGWVLVE